jgi:hypothetical protein
VLDVDIREILENIIDQVIVQIREGLPIPQEEYPDLRLKNKEDYALGLDLVTAKHPHMYSNTIINCINYHLR